MYLFRNHTFHIVDPSPWPFLISFGAGSQIPVGAVMYMHGEKNGLLILITGLILLIFIMFLWWWDIIIEGTYQGMHTKAVQRGLRIGFLLFIVSEIMFFVSFFWAFFHSALAATIEISGKWAMWRVRILMFKPYKIPLLNTMILLTSGLYITAAHGAVVRGKFWIGFFGFFLTLLLAIGFTVFQYMEYVEAPFDISYGIFGSLFYMMTGFHGFHVIIGTIFIFITFIRFWAGHLTPKHHVGLEAAVWYWHFVDVVWLLLYCAVYWWSRAPQIWWRSGGKSGLL